MKDFFELLKKIIEKYLYLLGIIFPVVEIIESYNENIHILGNMTFVFLLPAFISIVWFFLSLVHINYKIDGRNHKISIIFGNILKKKSSVAIVGINSSLETHKTMINQQSIHGQLLELVNEKVLLKEFNDRKNTLKKKRGSATYKYGECFFIEIGSKEYLFLVMSDLKSLLGATSSTDDIKAGITNMFDNIRVHGGSKKSVLDCPILGTGIVDTAWTEYEAIKYILKSYICASKKEGFGITHFRICIPYKKFLSTFPNLYKLKKYCECISENCFNCDKL